MGWDAPPDGFDDDKIPETPHMVLGVLMVVSIVVPTILGMLVVVCSGWYGYRHCAGNKHGDELKSFLLSLHELCDKLQVYCSLTLKRLLISTNSAPAHVFLNHWV